jgi:hypothetical protein
MAICRTPSNWCHDFSGCLYDWQTLIGALLALGVGAFTITKVRQQIEQQDRLHDAGRLSRFSVAKAKAPLAAVEILDHVRIYRKAFEEVLALTLSRRRLEDQKFEFVGPAFPKEASDILDSLIENSRDESLIYQISTLYSEWQVMRSRANGIYYAVEHAIAIDAYIVQTLIINAISIKILEFGRDGKPISQITLHNVRNEISNNIINRTTQDRIFNYIDNKIEQKAPLPPYIP